MKKRDFVTYALMAAMCLGLTGCTTAGDNFTEYFDQVSGKIDILTSSSSSDDDEDEDTTETAEATNPLDTPGDFTVDDDGNYSFSGVENADYYLIYMYDENTDSDSYTYMSSSIEEDGSGTYTGNLSDFTQYAYSDYRIEVLAYPSVTDDEHDTSEAATAEIHATGEVSDPEFTYIWSCFSDELTVTLSNTNSYSNTAYPTSITITLTNEADSSDVVTATLEDVSGMSSSLAISGVTLDATYDITADVEWDENYVTNSSTTAELGSIVVASTEITTCDDYSYSSSVYNYMAYPLMAYNFDVTEGGELGSWTSSSSGFSMPGAEETDPVSVIFTCTPVDAEDGDLYTYTWVAANSDGSALSSGNFGTFQEATGTLHIYEDGTFLMEADAYYMWTDTISSANQYHDASSIEGLWVDNGDGTITMAFDQTTETDLGYADAEQ